MFELFKIYSRKYFKDALYVNICAWFLVFLTAYVNPKIDKNEVSLTYFFSLNIILFLFSYPLEECLKWVLVSPFKKIEIFLFNIFFQFFKLFLSGIYFSLNLFFFDLPLSVEKKKATFQEDYFFNQALDQIMDSRFFFGIVLFIIFIIVTLFSPSPKLILAQPGFLKLKWKDLIFYLKKYRYFVFIFIFALPGIKLLKNYWNSPIIIYTLGFTYLTFNFFHSYFKKLKFSFIKKKKYYLAILFIFVTIFTSLKIYSNNRIKRGSLGSENLASEVLFQRSFYLDKTLPHLNEILRGDLKFRTFKKLKSYLEETSQISSLKLEEKIKSISLLDFLNKKEDPLWALYLANKAKNNQNEPQYYKLLKTFFFKNASEHPIQLRLTKKFAKLTLNTVNSPKDLEKHLKSGNKLEAIYTFHILRLKKENVYKIFLKKNMNYFENFIRVKKSIL
ncbi:MAG: hypothetical protein CME68_04395 [Halobacteriovoraceae bacterium]|nr:hypothetical protein [Halobacteriovoraceae bacterium]